MKNIDLLFGFKSENILLNKIKKLYGQNIKKTNMYHIFDYENENYLIELKTRRIFYNQYKDIMIGLNKLKFAETSEKKCIFLWKMKNGLYMWEFNKNNYSVRMGGRCDRGIDERKMCGYIDTKLLIKV
jgi:hypothetical protein